MNHDDDDHSTMNILGTRYLVLGIDVTFWLCVSMFIVVPPTMYKALYKTM